MVEIIIAVVALAIGGGIGYAIFRYVLKGQYQEVMDKARKDAEVVKEKKLLEVKEKFLNKKSELEKEVQQRNQRIQQSENRLKQRELNLNQRQEEISRRRQDVEQQQQRLDNEKKMLQVRHQELDKMQEQEREKLEELSGLSAEEAKTRLVESMKDQARLDAASYVNEIVDEAKLNANQQAKNSNTSMGISSFSISLSFSLNRYLLHEIHPDMQRIANNKLNMFFLVMLLIWYIRPDFTKRKP